jgi:DNA-binding transcriptional regulator YhcF (GntR family)
MPPVPDELKLQVERGSGVPIGVQLAAQIGEAVRSGALAPGARLPSVRELAEQAGVNVNTARAVYARLESRGVVRSEQGRGTFVAGPTQARAPDAETLTRRELREEIARLEAALVRLPPPPLREEPANRPALPRRPTLLSTADLEAVRDDLLARLHELDAQRAELMQRLEQLEAERPQAQAERERPVAERPAPARGSTPSLAGARIRWVGA